LHQQTANPGTGLSQNRLVSGAVDRAARAKMIVVDPKPAVSPIAARPFERAGDVGDEWLASRIEHRLRDLLVDERLRRGSDVADRALRELSRSASKIGLCRRKRDSGRRRQLLKRHRFYPDLGNQLDEGFDDLDLALLARQS